VYAKGVEETGAISEVIRDNGGKVQKVLTKAATHLIWTNGSAKVLQRTKQPEFEHLHIVSHKWVIACLESQMLKDVKEYAPAHV
jgi:hypothetical protein